MPIRPNTYLPRLRLLPWSSPEFAQATVRLVIVGLVNLYAWTDYSAAHLASRDYVGPSRWVSFLAGVAATLILVSTLRAPAASVTRRLVGITHDTATISMAMYMGLEANAAFGVLYLIIIVGNGIRFGALYMGYATAFSLLGFGAVHHFSPFWQSTPTLSFYITALLVVVPAYMYGPLRSLHRVRAELEQRANHDHLTGLMNRANIEQRILEAVTNQPRGNVLLYMDLDRFKHVNDSAGHAAGDTLLKEVARVIRRAVRDHDLCARLGGDEFCVLLLQCDMPTAARIAERIREEVQKFRLLWGGRVYSVGTSIGVAASDSVQDGQSLLRLADAACYAAKNEGRNSVHVVGPNQRVTDTGLLRKLPGAE